MDEDTAKSAPSLSRELPDKPSPINNAYGALEDEVTRLGEHIADLSRQLSPVLRETLENTVQSEKNGASRDVEGHSPHVQALSITINRIRAMTEVVNYLNKNLEV